MDCMGWGFFLYLVFIYISFSTEYFVATRSIKSVTGLGVINMLCVKVYYTESENVFLVDIHAIIQNVMPAFPP